MNFLKYFYQSLKTIASTIPKDQNMILKFQDMEGSILSYDYCNFINTNHDNENQNYTSVMNNGGYFMIIAETKNIANIIQAFAKQLSVESDSKAIIEFTLSIYAAGGSQDQKPSYVYNIQVLNGIDIYAKNLQLSDGHREYFGILFKKCIISCDIFQNSGALNFKF